MSNSKKIFDLVILGTALAFATVIGNSALAVAGIIIVMLSDRMGSSNV